MKAEIVEKLKVYLQTHEINKEDEVVYIMVELRKLLDRHVELGIDDNFHLIRFYCDWTVHTAKNHITPAMKDIIRKIDENLDPYPREDNVAFLLLPEFRNEIKRLFEFSGFDASLYDRSEKWKKFVIALSQVLSDQPMIDPISNIKEFRYITRNNEHISVNIDFKDIRGSITIVVATDTI